MFYIRLPNKCLSSSCKDFVISINHLHILLTNHMSVLSFYCNIIIILLFKTKTNLLNGNNTLYFSLKCYNNKLYLVAFFEYHFLSWFEVFVKDPSYLRLLWNKRNRVLNILSNIVKTKTNVPNGRIKIITSFTHKQIFTNVNNYIL